MAEQTNAPYVYPNKRYYIPEIIDLVNNAPSEVVAGSTIRFFSRNKAFLDILRYAFDTRLELFETDVPPYDNRDPNAYGLDPSSLEQETKRFYIFEKKMTPRVTRIRQERNLIEMLEGLNHQEAEVVKKVFRNELHGKYINPEFINRVIPEFIPKEYWRPAKETIDTKSGTLDSTPTEKNQSVPETTSKASPETPSVEVTPRPPLKKLIKKSSPKKSSSVEAE